ncbi:ribonuclease H-like domain-containing protein, partial [Tanacetum coccineum]
LHYKIHTLSQSGSSIADYYHKLNALWKQFDALVELPRCTYHVADGFKKRNQLMKLMLFLIGLPLVILLRPLKDLGLLHSLLMFLIERIIRDLRCFKIIGYPPNFGKKKAGQNVKGKNVSNNDVGSSSSSGFFDEQLSTLISFIKENSVNGKGVQANMADSTVSHPNGIEAFITKISNMPLTDYLTLFDVLVVPEYCVSLMSVHKVARDSKMIFAFDELKYYILNQDLNARKVLGTGRQFGGYITLMEIKVENLRVFALIMFVFLSKYTWNYRLGHPADQVLNVLRPSLLFENDKSDVMCDICQRAKQTREPFPLSDHVSTEIRKLVHLDL